MRTDPFSDTLMWLTDFRWEVVISWLLLIGSFVVAGANWRTDPAQRTIENVAIWVFRLLIGAMWYQGTTWKLPLPYSDAFAHWLGETGQYAAFPFVRDLVHGVFEPLLPVVGTLIYFAELFFAVTLMLGALTRLGALLALGQATVDRAVSGAERMAVELRLPHDRARFLHRHRGRPQPRRGCAAAKAGRPGQSYRRTARQA